MTQTRQVAPPRPGDIAIASLTQAQRQASRYDAVLTIEDPRPSSRFRRMPHHRYDRIALRFEDLDEDHHGLWTPARHDADAILAFGRKHRDASLLVHCQAGIARSTAAALGIIADRLGPGREAEAVAALLAVRPPACANLALLAHLDAALGRDGALLAAWQSHEDGSEEVRKTRLARRLLFERAPLDFARRPADGAR